MGLESRGREGSRFFSGPSDIGPVIEAAQRLFEARYGGAWYENDVEGGRKLVVAVAGDEALDAASLRDALGGDTTWLEVVPVRYSEAQLLEFFDQLNSVLDQARPTGTLVLGPDRSNNCIKLEINPEDAERLMPRLKAVVPDDALVVQVARFTVGPG